MNWFRANLSGVGKNTILRRRHPQLYVTFGFNAVNGDYQFRVTRNIKSRVVSKDQQVVRYLGNVKRCAADLEDDLDNR